jgi:hypothetical protein
MILLGAGGMTDIWSAGCGKQRDTALATGHEVNLVDGVPDFMWTADVPVRQVDDQRGSHGSDMIDLPRTGRRLEAATQDVRGVCRSEHCQSIERTITRVHDSCETCAR